MKEVSLEEFNTFCKTLDQSCLRSHVQWFWPEINLIKENDTIRGMCISRSVYEDDLPLVSESVNIKCRYFIDSL